MFKLKNTLRVKAITAAPLITELFPIRPARELLPSWYKGMPVSVEKGECPVKRSITNQVATIKSCYGVNTLLSKGFIVPAWEDISIVVYPNGTFSTVFARQEYNGSTPHPSSQLPGSLQHLSVLKLHSPWSMYASDTTHFLYTPAVYHNTLGISHFLPSGVMEFKYQHGSHIFLAVEKKDEPYEILIKAGQPLMHLVPLTERRVELECCYDPTHTQEKPPSLFLLHGYQRLMAAIRKDKNAS